MSTLTPTTELEAVNQMLGTIMEAPINTLVGVESLDAQKAIAILNEISRDLQARGWNFNTERGFPLVPREGTGEIILPANCLSVDGILCDGLDLVQRGKRIYDRGNQTFELNQTVKVDMTVMLPFSDLPETARRYIAVRSCRVFQHRMVGSTTLSEFTAEDEMNALMSFRRVMGQTGDHNIFNSPDMRRMMRRR